MPVVREAAERAGRGAGRVHQHAVVDGGRGGGEGGGGDGGGGGEAREEAPDAGGVRVVGVHAAGYGVEERREVQRLAAVAGAVVEHRGGGKGGEGEGDELGGGVLEGEEGGGGEEKRELRAEGGSRKQCSSWGGGRRFRGGGEVGRSAAGRDARSSAREVARGKEVRTEMGPGREERRRTSAVSGRLYTESKASVIHSGME